MTITEPRASPSTCKNTALIFSWELEAEKWQKNKNHLHFELTPTLLS